VAAPTRSSRVSFFQIRVAFGSKAGWRGAAKAGVYDTGA
jgi:hypothetical protein